MVTNTDPETSILIQGKMTLKGEFLWGSNYTFLVEITHQGITIPGVYKPVRGEQPLWDFPAASLARREVAAYIVSEVLGWRLVPPTVYRKDGPLGAGSLQLFVEHDPEYHYFNFLPEDIQLLRPVAVFDMLINNADRKGSHILKGSDGKLWLIDHGVCFHVDDKLRTVIWNFAGEAIPDNLCTDLTRFINSDHSDKLLKSLSRTEIRALSERAAKICSEGVFPYPNPNRRPFPWPKI